MSVINGPDLVRTFASRKKFIYIPRPEAQLLAGEYVRQDISRDFINTAELSDYDTVNIFFVKSERLQEVGPRGMWEYTEIQFIIICEDYPFVNGVEIGDVFVETDDLFSVINAYMVKKLEETCPQSGTVYITALEMD